MTWYTPTNRLDHPCILPDAVERLAHRLGQMYRCEVCTDLWVLDEGMHGDREWKQVMSPWLRWIHRKGGYSNANQD